MERLYNISLYWKSYAAQAISFLFIMLFTYAAASKLFTLEKFQIQMEQSPFLSTYAEWLVWFIPTVEILISLLFFSFRSRLLALYASLILMLLFTIYIIAVLKFAGSIPCSCGGVIASLSWNQHLIFNIGFILLALTGISLSKKKP